MKKFCLAMAFGLACQSLGSARAACLSYSAARATFPGQHLRWFGKAHCWTSADDVRIAADISRPPARAARPAAADPVDQNKTILMPQLMKANANLAADYLDAHSFLFSPLLLDLDMLQRHPFKPWNERIGR
jgi:hypothetical protein